VNDTPAALLLLIYAFVGFESALIPAGEARDPQRDLPRALLLALLMVTLLYMGIQAACLTLLADLASSTAPLLDATAVLAGPAGAAPWATSLLMTGIIASVSANLSGAMFSTPRLSYVLAGQGLLPAWFGVIDRRFLTPAHAIWFFGALALLLASVGSFLYLAAATVLIRALLYGLCCAALPVLRRRQPSALRLPLARLWPALGILVCLWLALQVSAASVTLTLALIAVGVILSRIARRAKPEADQINQ
jgi:amino acid transporter